MAHDDTREGNWKGNWRMDWVTSTLHTSSEHGVSRITTSDAHNSATSIRLNWRPRRFKWTRTFRRKTKPSFCACAITVQTQSTSLSTMLIDMPDHQYSMVVVTDCYTGFMLAGRRTALQAVSLQFIIPLFFQPRCTAGVELDCKRIE